MASTAAAACVLSGCVLGLTGDPHMVTDNSAELTGTLQSTQSDHADYWFEYGRKTRYGSATEHTGVDVPNTPVLHVGANIDGLRPGSTYHYRLCSDVTTDNLPPFCYADRTVTTGVGRVSVQAHSFSTGELFPLRFTSEYTVRAVADPGGVGYVDGTAEQRSTATFIGGSPQVTYHTGGMGPVACLRVAGNVAVAGWTMIQTSDAPGSAPSEVSLLLVAEDAGATGDRLAVLAWTPADGCPEPSASLLGNGAMAATVVVSGG